jgi:hypothetical protein
MAFRTTSQACRHSFFRPPSFAARAWLAELFDTYRTQFTAGAKAAITREMENIHLNHLAPLIGGDIPTACGTAGPVQQSPCSGRRRWPARTSRTCKRGTRGKRPRARRVGAERRGARVGRWMRRVISEATAAQGPSTGGRRVAPGGRGTAGGAAPGLVQGNQEAAIT